MKRLIISFLFSVQSVIFLAGCSELQTTQTKSPIRHIIIHGSSPLPEAFARARLDYMSNESAANRALLFKYRTVDDIVEFEDGWLVSADKGEWGGILYWLGRDGELDILIRNSNNSTDLVVLDDTVVLSRKPFYPVGNSNIYRIQKTDVGLNVEKFEIPGQALGFEKRNGELLLKSTTRQQFGVSEAYHDIDNIFTTVQPSNIDPPSLK